MDINFSYETANKSNENKPILIKKIDKFLQEIDIAISINKYDFFGKTDLSDKSIESLMWRSDVSASEVANFIQDKIRKKCALANDFNFTVNAYFMKGAMRDMCVVDTQIVDKINEMDIRNLSILYK